MNDIKKNRSLRRFKMKNKYIAHTQDIKKKLEELDCANIYKICINNYIYTLDEFKSLDLQLLNNKNYNVDKLTNYLITL